MVQNTDENTAVLCFDYACKNYYIQKKPVQAVSYKWQLWLNVFCEHNKTKKVKIYIYHKGEANRSPENVCFMILHYLKTEVPSETKHLILFSDCPSGQNKNHCMVRF